LILDSLIVTKDREGKVMPEELQSGRPLKRSSTFRPQLERLEDRLAPVVGAGALPPMPLTAGGEFDGVVSVRSAPVMGAPPAASALIKGTGALLSTGSHILTAAHVLDGTAGNVVFQMQRNRMVLGLPTPLSVPIAVPFQADAALNTVQVRHPGFLRGNPVLANGHIFANDIALIRLVDPVTQPFQHDFFGCKSFSSRAVE